MTKLVFFQERLIAWTNYIAISSHILTYSHDAWPQFLIQTAPGQLALSSVERLDPHVWANPEGDGVVPMGDGIL